MKWKWIVYLRKQWLLLLIKLYSLSTFKPQKTMDDLIRNAYNNGISIGIPYCEISGKHKNQKGTDYESLYFNVNLPAKGLINISINIVNQDLVFTTTSINFKDINSQYLLTLATELSLIESSLIPQLKPYFGL